jgi:hypothetical protein
MSIRTFGGADRSRRVKRETVGGSVAVLAFAVACIATAMFLLAAMMPNPVTLIEDVIIRPQIEAGVASSRAEVNALVDRCRAEQATVELKTSSTTEPRCAQFADYIRSTPIGHEFTRP